MFKAINKGAHSGGRLPCQCLGRGSLGHGQVGGGKEVGRGKLHIGRGHVVIDQSIISGYYFNLYSGFVGLFKDRRINFKWIGVSAKRTKCAVLSFVQHLLIANGYLQNITVYGLATIVAHPHRSSAALSFLNSFGHIHQRYCQVYRLLVGNAYIVEIHLLLGSATEVGKLEAKLHPLLFLYPVGTQTGVKVIDIFSPPF